MGMMGRHARGLDAARAPGSGQKEKQKKSGMGPVVARATGPGPARNQLAASRGASRARTRISSRVGWANMISWTLWGVGISPGYTLVLSPPTSSILNLHIESYTPSCQETRRTASRLIGSPVPLFDRPFATFLNFRTYSALAAGLDFYTMIWVA